VSIDDTEQACLKVMMDETFGRGNFIANVIWEKKFSLHNDAKWLSDDHDFIMVYAKTKIYGGLIYCRVQMKWTHGTRILIMIHDAYGGAVI
jgi:adenine specific DNA methylase Mod